MRVYKIAVWGDNDHLHEEALAAAVKAAEAVNKAPVYRAWVEWAEFSVSGHISESNVRESFLASEANRRHTA